MLEEPPYKIKGTKKTPWTEKLLNIQKYAKKLDKEWRGIFHTYMMKAMFCAREHGPILTNKFSFYPQESWTQMREIRRNYCVL